MKGSLLFARVSNWLRDRPTAKDILENLLQSSRDADEAASRTNDFLRLWATFHFPRLLRALDRIQRDVLGRRGLSVGNYEYFAAAVENLFLDPAIVALDEYGIPLEVGRKLENQLQADGSIDTALQALRDISVEDTNLSEFEKDLVRDAQAVWLKRQTLAKTYQKHREIRPKITPFVKGWLLGRVRHCAWNLRLVFQ